MSTEKKIQLIPELYGETSKTFEWNKFYFVKITNFIDNVGLLINGIHERDSVCFFLSINYKINKVFRYAFMFHKVSSSRKKLGKSGSILANEKSSRFYQFKRLHVASS